MSSECRVSTCYREPLADTDLCAVHDWQRTGVVVPGTGLTYRTPEGAAELEETPGGGEIAEKIRAAAAGEEPPANGNGAHEYDQLTSVGGRAKWTTEKVVAAIREVAEHVEGTPSRADMAAHGYGGACQASTVKRLGVTFADLVREAGFEPRGRGDNRQSGRTHRTRPVVGKAKPLVSDHKPTDPDRKDTDPVRDPDVGKAAIAMPPGPYGPTIAQLQGEATALELRALSLRRIADELRQLGEAPVLA